MDIVGGVCAIVGPDQGRWSASLPVDLNEEEVRKDGVEKLASTEWMSLLQRKQAAGPSQVVINAREQIAGHKQMSSPMEQMAL